MTVTARLLTGGRSHGGGAISRLQSAASVAVHEDSPDVSLAAAAAGDHDRSLCEDAAANTKTIHLSNQRAKNQFRPRVGKGGATSYQLRQYAEVTLGGGSLRKVVKLPEGEDENEWLAVNSKKKQKLRCMERQFALTLVGGSGRLLQPD